MKKERTIVKQAIKEYTAFLEAKATGLESVGIEVGHDQLNPKLFDFQKDITAWALRRGRAAVFADTGLGKTNMQLEWATQLGGSGLIVAPLTVARQTVRLGEQFGYKVKYCRHQSEIQDGLNITNYEMVEEFDPSAFHSVVIDESSILKALDGKTRRTLTDMFKNTPYRLCCTATPAPNDRSEIGNHAEFLGICTFAEMLSMFFVHDEQEWRLKGHATQAFYRWLSSWSMSIRKPSDLGYSDKGYDLPPLTITPVFVDVDYQPTDELFFSGLKGIKGRLDVRRETIDARLNKALELVKADNDQWILWCGLNPESAAAAKGLEDSIEVKGSDSAEEKAHMLESFQDGTKRVLVTKPKIAGFGMNFQNAHKMAFIGLSDSWEAYYQCIRRCFRFGQNKPVEVYIILSQLEKEIYQNVMNKEREAKTMSQDLINHVKDYEMKELKHEEKVSIETEEKTIKGDSFLAMLGDSTKRLAEVKTDSVHLSVYSPPFANLYTYSDKIQDLGNSRSWDEFFQHYQFIIKELLRVTKPGRLTAVHSSDIPAMQVKDGYIGMRDFPGAIITAYEKAGWVFRGRVTIDKDPQAQAIRTKSKSLLFVQMEKDASWSRPAIGDYIILFAKPGENQEKITPVANGEMTREMWIEWARPVWYGISESDTLQYTTARDAEDERHICPLQLGVIERCIKLWSNPGETILTPFGGIGSEAYQAIRFGRRAILCELKPSYFRIAVENLRNAESLKNQETLFGSAL